MARTQSTFASIYRHVIHVFCILILERTYPKLKYPKLSSSSNLSNLSSQVPYTYTPLRGTPYLLVVEL